MKKSKAEAKKVLDTRRIRKDGTYPVKLKLTFKRERKYYSTTYNLTEQEWEMVKGESNRGDNRKIKLALAAIETSAQACADTLENFNFQEFETAYSLKA